MSQLNRPVPSVNIEEIPLTAPPPYTELDPNASNESSNYSGSSVLRIPPRIPSRTNINRLIPVPKVPSRSNSIIRRQEERIQPPIPNRISGNDRYSPGPKLPPRPSSASDTPELPARLSSTGNSPVLPARPQFSPSRSNSYSRGSDCDGPPLPTRPSSRSNSENITTNLQGWYSQDPIDQQMDNLNLSNTLFDTKLGKDAPPSMFTRTDHDVQIPNVYPQYLPIETNKFYGNILLGDQTLPIWTHPYSVWYSKEDEFRGLAISHTKASQRVFGDGDPPQFFFSPPKINSLTLSAMEFQNSGNMDLQIKNPKHMSVNLEFRLSNDQFMQTPLIQGMGFVSAVYHYITPVIYSSIGFRSLEELPAISRYTQKFESILENGRKWIIYISSPDNTRIAFKKMSNNAYSADKRLPEILLQTVVDGINEIDNAAGCYPVDCVLSAISTNSTSKYGFHYKTIGFSNSGSTLMFALPHHVETFTEEMTNRKVDLYLDSTVKGIMTAYITNDFDMELATIKDLGFQPFSTIPGKNKVEYNNEQLEKIRNAASMEVMGDVIGESNLDSMYFSGKILAKYAWILYCCQFILNDSNLVNILLPKLKLAMRNFTTNTQKLPLRYDTSWKGIISSGNESQDFGNSYYNDHHFHSSYHVQAAAIIVYVEKQLGTLDWYYENKEWVEVLIRDYANPIEDKYFPVYRSFDWYHGHSWAKGLFASGDGKDQESSSEDVNAAYALKLWSIASDDQNLGHLSDIQLAVLQKSITHYFLYASNNITEPFPFIKNKVSGILFENKIDHTTYFGNLPQYIHMIHAIPITPASSFIRTPQFVKEEWDCILSQIVGGIEDGWKGIIMLNVALFNPTMSYQFFSSDTFDKKFLDPGQSLTWSLVYSAAFT
ncbi:hypothetical protein TPHA_0A01440 [Tetrapisispora phaffii CBS 4417]|uniref:glucan endo-1,3-beta-D-glucosidase n=1 Tax=Tetrapisispora phaffii (strain ATCC 24235 / CBS 4417 / NBRC 1672 / NRRL Y-8282 / UCD 70-5) TaxID=1071381 RepID=G8BMU9_TETPH|nr:hypothetical protein TPHA_0A01440 [Tetrapisispora phaffii CBS 4417]CCE61227.1 hypothetical protein TPHA_0A01440 [Tetrapisispora phaffii CBS 4417]